MAEPTWLKSKTERAEDSRAKLLSDREDPMWTYSSTDSEKTEPKRAMPKSEMDEPKREQLRKDKDEPRCKKSNTDKADDRRANDLSDNEAPR
jgi:hypothetical protein